MKDIQQKYKASLMTNDTARLDQARNELINKDPREAYRIFDRAEDTEGLKLLGRKFLGTDTEGTEYAQAIAQARSLECIRFLGYPDARTAINALKKANDIEGLIAYGEKVAEIDPRLAYEAFQKAKCHEKIDDARRQLIENETPSRAYTTLSEAHDTIGLKLLGESVAQKNAGMALLSLEAAVNPEGLSNLGRNSIGNNPIIAELCLKLSEDDEGLKRLGEEQLDKDPFSAYQIFSNTNDEQGRDKSRKRMIEQNPTKVIETFRKNKDTRGEDMFLDHFSQKPQNK